MCPTLIVWGERDAYAVPELAVWGQRDDLPLLVEYFVARLSRRAGKRIDRVDRQSLETLTQYNWPGDIRGLADVYRTRRYPGG